MTLERDGARILVVGTDPALFGLLEEWLGAEGFGLVQETAGVDGFDLVLVDVAFPRDGSGLELLRRVGSEHSGTPMLALSSNFFPRVEGNGDVARALGVAAVLAKPLSREALIAAVRKLVPSPG